MATELFDVPSFNIMQARIAMILGNGAGDKGYGQTLLSTQLDTSVSVQNYINLRADILKARFHQKGNITSPIPTITNLVDIATWNAIKATMANVELDRLVIPPSTHGFVESLVSENSSDVWNSTTSHTVVVSFDDVNAMRYYFNTGSYISFTSVLTGGLTSGAGGAKKTSWASLLSSIGEIRFKYNATTSTKVTGTTKGFRDLTSTDQKVFNKTFTSIPSNNDYTINARLSADSEITFTITFTNTGENVTGTLTSSVKSFHAGNADSNLNAAMVNVPKPDVQSLFVLGDANPTFTPSRSSTAINESGTNTSVTISVTATNFSGPLFYKIIGTLNGRVMSDITVSDFIDVPLEGEITIGDNGSTETPLVITANADNLTEGKETFDIEFRTVDSATAPVVTSIVKFLQSSISINDTSTTLKSPVLVFAKQTVKSVSEGSTVSFTINGSNVPNNSTVYWEIVTGSGTLISSTDFIDGVLSGSFIMSNNTYTLDISVIDDKTVEKVELFRIYVYMLDSTGKKITSSQAYSEMMQIIDAVAVTPDVPFVALPPTVSSIVEGATTGVTFNVTTPLWCTKLWYTVITDLANGTNEVTTLDFRDKIVDGFITITKGKGSLTKIAALDTITEGTERFHVDFFTDADCTANQFSTDTVNITENITYTVARSSLTVLEGSPAGVTFTVSTPYTPNEPQTFLKWTVIGESGTLQTSDFYDNLLTDTVPVVNNTAIITLRPRIDGFTEGTESFYLKIDTSSGTFITNSPSVSILEDVRYAISAQRTVTAEGEAGIDFDITTPYLPLNTKLYWATVPVTGSITPSDFSDNVMAGYFFINPTTITNTYTLTRAAASDSLTEGTESFYISLRTSASSSTEVARSDTILITENVRCRIVPTTQILTEGQPAMTFNITTMKIDNNTKVYWKINPMKGNIIPEDFIVSDNQGGSANRLSGYALTHNNTASFSISAKSDTVTEDDETFTVSIHLNSIDAQAEDTSSILTIRDVSPFIITADTTSVKEAVTLSDLPNANVVTFTVFTPWMTDGTVLYWTTKSLIGIAASDFSDGKLQDTVKVYGNKCTISRQIAADKTTENNNVFAIQIRRNSYTDPVVPNGTSPSITIIDNSISPEIIDPSPFEGDATITEKTGKSSVVEGGSVTFVIETTGVAVTDDLYWSTLSLSSLADDLIQTESMNVFHVTGTSDPRSKEVQIFTKTNNDTKGPGGKAFLFRVHHGNNSRAEVIGVIPMLITDPVSYSVSATPQSIGEGGTSTTITVTSPDLNQAIPFAITTASGSFSSSDITVSGAISYNNLSGTVLINSSGVGTFIIAAAADGITEGTESFNVELPGKSASATVKITESISYSLQPTNLQSPYTVNANSDVSFTLTTPKLSSTLIDNGLYWVLVGLDISDKFSSTSDQILGLNSSTYSYTFTIHSLTSDSDKDVEIQIRIGSDTGPQITNFTTNINRIKLIGNPALYSTGYILLLKNAQGQTITTDTSIAEGSSFSFELTTLKPDTTFTWLLVPDPLTATAMISSDFTSASSKVSSTTPVITDKFGKSIIPFTFSTGRNHGNKTFHLEIQIDGVTVNGGTSVSITRTENSAPGSSAYSIKLYSGTTELTQPYNVLEQTPITFKVFTPNIGNVNKTYTWGVLANPPVTLLEYPATSGPFQINASTSSGELTIGVPQARPAGVTIPPEGRTFKIIITNDTGTVVIPENVSPVIKITSINDSLYKINTQFSDTSVVKGDSVVFVVTRPAVNSGNESVSWALSSVSGTIGSLVSSPLTGSVNFTGSQTSKRVTILTRSDATVNQSFRMTLPQKSGVHSQDIVIQNPPTLGQITTIWDTSIGGVFNEVATRTVPNGVTFTVQVEGAIHVGTYIYFRISETNATVNDIESTQFSTDSSGNTIFSGRTTSTDINGLMYLEIYAKDNNKVDDPPLYLVVEFGTTPQFTTTKKSRAIRIVDKSSTSSSLNLGLWFQSIPSKIRLGETFYVGIYALYSREAIQELSKKDLYNPAPVLDFTFSYTADVNISRNIKLTANNTETSQTTITLTSTTRGVIPQLPTFFSDESVFMAASDYVNRDNAVYGLVKFTTTQDLVNDPCGPIQITIKVTDPLTNQAISKTLTVAYVQHSMKTVELTASGKWTIPDNVNQLSFELYGGGGFGGGPAALRSNAGYAGGSGDLVRGSITVTPNQSLYIGIVNGGAASLVDSTGNIGQGGQGGNGILLYNGSSSSGTLIASAGGGGGGQGFNATNNGTIGNSSTTTSTYSSSIVAAGTASTTANGAGGGGGGGGKIVQTTAPVVTTNGGNSFIQPSFVCTPGGAGNRQVGGVVSSTRSVYKKPSEGGSTIDSRWSSFMATYAIFDESYIKNPLSVPASFVAEFNQVDINPIGSQQYILKFSTSNECTFVIGGSTSTVKPPPGNNSYTELTGEIEFTIPSNWNRNISISLIVNSADRPYMPGRGLSYGVAATLRLKGYTNDPAYILWATNSPTMIYSSPNGSSTSPGIARALIKYSPDCPGSVGPVNEWFIPGAYTVTVPDACILAQFYIVGGGGGGGGGLDRSGWAGSSGGGGGSGACYIFTLLVTPNTPINIVVGKGGAGGGDTVVSGATGYGGSTTWNNTPNCRVGHGSNGSPSSITYAGVDYIAGGGNGGNSGVAYFTSTDHPLPAGTRGPSGGMGGVTNQRKTLKYGDGGDGQLDVSGGSRTNIAAAGGVNNTPYGSGGSSKSISETSDPTSWATVSGLPGFDGYACVIWR